MQLTARYPFPYSGDIERTVKDLQDWAVSLLDSLQPTLNNLDAGNVLEAASVKAENIDTRHAKIKDAQIQDLTADKLTAGTIDAQVIDVIRMTASNIITGTLFIKDNMEIKNQKRSVKLDSESFTIYDDDENPRIQMGKVETEDKDEKYIFVMYGFDKEGNIVPTICLKDDGSAIFTGTVDASTIVGGTINGTEINGVTITGSTIRTDLAKPVVLILDENGLNAGKARKDSEGNISFEKQGWCLEPSEICGGELGMYVNGKKKARFARDVGDGTIKLDATVSGDKQSIVLKGGYQIKLDADEVKLNAKTMVDGSLYVNDEEVATQAEINDLKRKIRELEGKIDSMSSGGGTTV